MQKSIKFKIICILLLLVMLVGLMPLKAIAITAPQSDVSGTITLHFYNNENEYQYDSWGGKTDVTWGAYYWVQNGKIVATDGKDDAFAYGDNIGQSYTLPLTSTEVRSLKEPAYCPVRGSECLPSGRTETVGSEIHCACPALPRVSNVGIDLSR